MKMQGELDKRIKNNVVVDDYSVIAPFPRNMLLEVTNICNDACIFCANPKTSRKKKMMDFAFGKKIMKDAYEQGTREVGFYSTGEPLVNTELEKYIAYAKQIGYEYVYITTNGALLDRRRSESILNAGIDSVKFSVNASNAKDYLLVHGRDDFTCVKNNIFAFDQERKRVPKKVNLFISCVKTKYTLNIEDEFCSLFQSVADDIVFLKCNNEGGYMPEINEKLTIDGKGAYQAENNVCPIFFKNLYVTVEGYLTMCCTDFQNYLAVADLNKEHIKDAWNNMHAQKLREAHLTHQLDGLLCFNCLYNTKKKVRPLVEAYAVPFDYLAYDLTDVIERRIMSWDQ